MLKERKEIKKMYKLYDYYEGKQLIAESDNWCDICKAKKEYIKDTDGECDLEIEQDGEVC